MATKQNSGTSENSLKSKEDYTINLLPSRHTDEGDSKVYSLRRDGSAEVLGTIRAREFRFSPTQYNILLDPLSGPRRKITEIKRGEVEGELDIVDLEEYVNLDKCISELESEDTVDEDPGIESYWPTEDEKVYVLDGELRYREGDIEDITATEVLSEPMVDPKQFLKKAKSEGWTTGEIKDGLNGIPAGAD